MIFYNHMPCKQYDCKSHKTRLGVRFEKASVIFGTQSRSHYHKVFSINHSLFFSLTTQLKCVVHNDRPSHNLNSTKYMCKNVALENMFYFLFRHDWNPAWGLKNFHWKYENNICFCVVTDVEQKSKHAIWKMWYQNVMTPWKYALTICDFRCFCLQLFDLFDT